MDQMSHLKKRPWFAVLISFLFVLCLTAAVVHHYTLGWKWEKKGAIRKIADKCERGNKMAPLWHKHITCIYIDPSRHKFEKCLPLWFVSQSCLRQPLAVHWAKGAMEGDNFQNKYSTIQWIYMLCGHKCQAKWVCQRSKISKLMIP